MIRTRSCGVIVTDGIRLLIGHATGSPRWDIPKGQAEADECPETTARRELGEETGLSAEGIILLPLGHYSYLPRKDLTLFAWPVASMPDPAALVCRSYFNLRGRSVPEFDRFACPDWPDAVTMLGKAMAGVLGGIATQRGWL